MTPETLKQLLDGPMKTEVVSEAEIPDAIKRHEAQGRRLACVSNAGLSEPMRRLTFLPADAFTDGEEAT